jgi:hypothetical protein
VSPYDICACGDYRSDHEGGTGASRFAPELMPGVEQCRRFRLSMASKAVRA